MNNYTSFNYEDPVEVTISSTTDIQEVKIKATPGTDRFVGLTMHVSDRNGLDITDIVNTAVLETPMTVQGEQILPEDFDLRLLYSGLEVAPDERYWSDINAPAGENEIKFKVSCSAATSPIKLKFSARTVYPNDECDQNES